MNTRWMKALAWALPFLWQTTQLQAATQNKGLLLLHAIQLAAGGWRADLCSKDAGGLQVVPHTPQELQGLVLGVQLCLQSLQVVLGHDFVWC